MMLYDSPYSPNARKVRAVARELDLDLDRTEVDLLGGETKAPWFRAINPNGKLPVLVDGDFVLWESNAIATYLASLHPHAGLCPTEPRVRADIDRWLLWQLSSLAGPIARAGFQRVIRPKLRGEAPDESLVAEAMAELRPRLEVLEARLAHHEWLVGPLTVADFVVGAWVEMARDADLLGGYGHVQRWLGALDARPSWATTRNAL